MKRAPGKVFGSDWLFPALLTVLGIAFFSQLLFHGFVSDDFHLVKRVQDEGMFHSWGGIGNDSFLRPLTVLSFATDGLLWGTSPAGYHLTNLLWHLVCTLLIYFFGQRLLGKKEPAFLCGLLFLFLAGHSESVAWVSGRTDLIATALALAASLAFLKGSRLAVVLFALGLLAKESVVTLPLIWLLLSLADKTVKSRLPLLITVSLTVVLYLTLRLALSPGFISGAGFGFSPRELPGNLLRYLFRVFIPPLTQGLRPFLLSNLWMVPVSVLIALLLFWLTSRKKDQAGLRWALAGCFLAALLPVLPMKVSLLETQSERFLYFPGVFAVLFLVSWSYSVLSKRTARTVLAVMVIAQASFLQLSLLNWREGGIICERITRELAAIDPDSVVMVRVPDNYRGVYVFRNGLNEALSLRLGRSVEYCYEVDAAFTDGEFNILTSDR